MRRTRKLWYKNTNQKKHNHYTFVICCDKNGLVLRNSIPPVTEFWEIVHDTTFFYSDVIMNAHSLKMGIGKYIRKFKKVIDCESLTKKFVGNKFERAQDRKQMAYLFQTLEDALYHEELFFDGEVWCFGNIEFLHDIKSVIDEIRVCKCNVDFLELYPNSDIDVFNLDDWLNKYGFKCISRTITDKVKRNLEILSSKSNKKIKEEIWDNGMVLITKTDSNKEKKNKLPEIYHYEFLQYKYINEQKINENEF